MPISGLYYLLHDQLQQLILRLNSDYQCYGPQVKNGTIVYDRLTDVNQLPWNLTDIQAAGTYRLKEIEEHQAFAWTNGPQGVKPFLFKSQEVLWYAKKMNNTHIRFEPVDSQEPSVAIFGVRPCDIRAMLIQDQILINDIYSDPLYRKRRERLLIVAMNCTRVSANCFCVSAGGSPRATEHFDLVMTECSDGFIIASGSKRGSKVLKSLKCSKATSEQIQFAEERINHAERSQTKQLPTLYLRDSLLSQLDHPRWYEVAMRCLACANCTLVCPTCFCHNEIEQPTMNGEKSAHIRIWDSCFTSQHSYLFQGPIRKTTRDYYRQWLTHKLGTWFDQFGMSGCVGCGRCITWCPVGIDITEEAKAIYQSKAGNEHDSESKI